MLRGIGYVVARRDPDDPEEPRDWALFIEALLHVLQARFAIWSFAAFRRFQGRESTSARRPR